jgi:hypothetical protein
MAILFSLFVGFFGFAEYAAHGIGAGLAFFLMWLVLIHWI